MMVELYNLVSYQGPRLMPLTVSTALSLQFAGTVAQPWFPLTILSPSMIALFLVIIAR